MTTTMTPQQQQQRFPYGISSFENIVEDNFLYFDKTQTIERMETLGSYLKIWRPRRSGKSLFCDQLALYYDKGAADNTVFEHTYIGRNPTPNKSKYLVLFLSFSNVDTTGDLRENFRDHINARVLDFSKRYKNILKEDIEISQNHIRSMENLFSAVEMVREKLYLIVDEYDSFANRLLLEVDTSSADLGRNQYLATVADKESMLRNFGNVLKSATRTVLRRMFFTGVAPMAFSDGLSSLNMVEDVSSSVFFESQFGFTEEEVRRGLQHIFPDQPKEVDEHLEVMRENFNGYRFHPNQVKGVFNPQICLYYLKHLHLYAHPPCPLLDENIATPGDNVAQYLIKNYRGGKDSDSAGVFDFLRTKIGLPVIFADSVGSFRSKQLFEASSVDSALLFLAYHHGYLTYCDPSDPTRKGCLVSPNAVYRKMFVDTLTSEYIQTNYKKIKQNFGFDEEANPTKEEWKKQIKKLLGERISEYLIDRLAFNLTAVVFNILSGSN